MLLPLITHTYSATKYETTDASAKNRKDQQISYPDNQLSNSCFLFDLH